MTPEEARFRGNEAETLMFDAALHLATVIVKPGGAFIAGRVGKLPTSFRADDKVQMNFGEYSKEWRGDDDVDASVTRESSAFHGEAVILFRLRRA